MPKTFLLLFATAAAYAQTVSIGAKVGAPFTDPGGSLMTSRPYLVGPAVEFRLPSSFAVDVSAVYHHVRETDLVFTSVEAGTTSTTEYRTRASSWEFPVIGKRYFHLHSSRWQPYAGAGLALRTIGARYDGATTVTSASNLIATPFHIQSRPGVGLGATFAAGVRIHAGRRLNLLPELRYTRWPGREAGIARNDVGVTLGFRF
jgi:hypothetical protein